MSRGRSTTQAPGRAEEGLIGNLFGGLMRTRAATAAVPGSEEDALVLEYKELERTLRDILMQEDMLRNQTVALQTRRQALLRSQKVLEGKLMALDRNRALLVNRLLDMDQRMAKSNSLQQQVLVKKKEVSDKLVSKTRRAAELAESIEKARLNKEQTWASLESKREEFRSMSERVSTLSDSLTEEAEALATASKQRDQLETRVADARKMLAMMQNEIEAVKKARESGQVDAVHEAETADVQRRIDTVRSSYSDLQTQQAAQEEHMNVIKQRMSSIASERETIKKVLETLRKSEEDEKVLLTKLSRAESDLNKESRRLNTELSSLRSYIEQLSEKEAKIGSNVERMAKVRGTLDAELQKLGENKKLLAARLADIRTAEESLTQRIKQDVKFLNTLKDKSKTVGQLKARVLHKHEQNGGSASALKQRVQEHMARLPPPSPSAIASSLTGDSLGRITTKASASTVRPASTNNINNSSSSSNNNNNNNNNNNSGGSAAQSSSSSSSSSSASSATASSSASKYELPEKPSLASVVCYAENTTITGILTVTTFMILFEPDEAHAHDDKQRHDLEQLRFCVDMADVVACNLYDAHRRASSVESLDSTLAAKRAATTTTPSGKTSNEGKKLTLEDKTNRHAVLQIIFKENYRNRFNFSQNKNGDSSGSGSDGADQDGGKSNRSKIFGSALRFGGARRTVVPLYMHLDAAIKNWQVQVAEDEQVQQRRTASASADSSAVRSGAQSPVTKKEMHTVGESEIVDLEHLHAVIRATPTRYHLDDWACVYSMTHHGASLGTFHRLVDDARASILLFRDSNGKVFGGFASRPWRKQQNYFGTGESFVFDFRRKPKYGGGQDSDDKKKNKQQQQQQQQQHRKSDDDDNGGGGDDDGDDGQDGGSALTTQLHCYKWDGKNNFFLLVDDKSIAMGGGDHFAIYIDEQFQHGSSGPCETFNSPVLASAEDFVCHRFEVWAPTT